MFVYVLLIVVSTTTGREIGIGGNAEVFEKFEDCYNNIEVAKHLNKRYDYVSVRCQKEEVVKITHVKK